MNSKPKILVIGATGKTGIPVVEQARAIGLEVRAVIRQEDDRSDRLRAAGAQIVTGDVHDLTSVRSLIQGVDRIYFTYPPHLEHLVEATTNVAIAAREEGVSAVVNMSQIIAREDAPSPLTRQHWLAENILDMARVGAIHIRPAYFMENLLLFGSQSIAAQGKLLLPLGTRKHAPVAARDIAGVVVQLLREPEPYLGRRLVLTGPELLTLDEMAGVIGRQLGRPVEYVDLPIEQWGASVSEQAGLPAFLINHLQKAALDHREGLFERQTGTVESVTGGKPQTLAEFVQEQLPRFEGREAVFLGV